VEPLIAKLGDEDEYVRRAAAEALGMIGVDKMQPQQQAVYYVCAGKPDEAAKIGLPAVEPLIAKLGDEDEYVRRAAVNALGMIGAPAIKPLLARLDDKNPVIHDGVADALGNIGAPAVKPLLAKLAAATDSVVRRAAIDALGNTHDARAVGPVAALLGDENYRPNACRALTLIGAPALESVRAAFPDAGRPDWATLLVASCGDKTAAAGIASSQWNNAFAEAGRTPGMLTTTLSALSNAGTVSGVDGQVTELCLAYIRRGDIRIIPQMISLLNTYGDKQLAEDYLNCGQGDLNAAGAAWARAHGFDVGTGNGSSRAKWGGGR
jgi:hypothetical protein